MFAARASLLPTSEGSNVGEGGSAELALELNRIYAEPMPTIRKHSAIPGVGVSGRSASADAPSSTAVVVTSNNANNNKMVTVDEKGEGFPLLPLDNANAKSAITQRPLGAPRSPPFSPKSGTTSGFEDDRLNTKYKLGFRRTLHNKRRQIADYSTVMALIGIAIMVLETELSMASVCLKTEFCSIFLKSFVSLSTFILVGLLLYYHYIEIEIFKVDNSVDDWRIAISPVRVIRVLAEIIVCIIHPLPVDWSIKMYAISDSAVKEVQVSLDVALGVPMFLRLYLLARLLLLHSRLFTDASSRSIGHINRITFNARFVLKTLMTMCPGTVLMTFILTMFIIGSWILRICETAHNPAYYNLLNSMWLVSITFLAVGYGDFAPETYCGRTVAVFSGFMGAGCTALVVAVVARKLELTRSEKHVHNFMMNTQLSKRLKDSAANVLRETWLIFKYSKLAARPSDSKIREHQRRFLAAIKNLRKVKLEQRKIAEQCHNLVDFPKVLMGISDAVVDVRSVTVDSVGGIQRRMDAIEKDVLEIKAHLLSIQSGILQVMTDFREAQQAQQAAQQLQLQLLQLRVAEQASVALPQPYDCVSPSLDVVPSTAVLVSPPDQGLGESNIETNKGPSKYDPTWMRRQAAIQSHSYTGPSRVLGSQEEELSLWSHGGSVQTVIQHTGQGNIASLSTMRSHVPRATSAIETVTAYDIGCGGGDPSSIPRYHLIHQSQEPQRTPSYSSAINVSLDAPVAARATLDEEQQSSVKNSASASALTSGATYSSATGRLSLNVSTLEQGSGTTVTTATGSNITTRAPLAKKSESKL